MGEKIDRVLTIVEGRKRNENMTNELIDAAKKAGFEINQIKTPDEDKTMENRLAEDFTDMVLWRGPANETSAAQIDRAQAWINQNCKITVNTSVLGGRRNTANKMYQHGSFGLDPYVAEHTLPMYQCLSRRNIDRLTASGKITYPFIFKPDLGVRGEGIVLIRNEADLDNFNGRYGEYSVEPYVESEYNWRTFVIGGVAIGYMRKTGNDEHPEDFIIKSGGQTHDREDDVEIQEEINRIATKAATASGLEYAGVDLIRDDETGRFYILETNSSGGWQNGYLKSTGIDIPTKIMEWFSDRIEIFEKKKSEAIKNYVYKRYKLLTRAGQDKYLNILLFKDEQLDEKAARGLLDDYNADLTERLKGAYSLVALGGMTEIDLVKIKDLISATERYEVSRFGNYIGKDTGSLEDSIEATTYYLAICQKLKL